MEYQLRHYHLGCGQRLQTDYLDFKNERRINFKLLSEKIFTKRNEFKKTGSTDPVTGKVK